MSYGPVVFLAKREAGIAYERFIPASSAASGAGGVPGAPILAGVIDVSNVVTLTWDLQVGATSYQIYKSLDGVSYSLFSSPSEGVFTDTDTQDPTGGLYYKIRAGNAQGFSGFSNVVDLTPFTPPPTYTFYYGRSALTVLNEAQILALSTRTGTSASANYVFGSGASYLYMAFPTTAGAPQFMKDSGLDLDLAATPEGYTNTTNGLTHTLITVGGVSHRLYRSLNVLNGAETIVVS